MRKLLDRSSRLGNLKIVVVVCIIWGLVAAGGIGYLIHRARQDRLAQLPPRDPEDPEQRRREIAEAFGNEKLAGEEEEVQALQAVFDALGAALRAKDSRRIADYFHFERMAEELKRMGLLPNMRAGGERSFVQGMRQGFTQGFGRQAEYLAWDRCQVRRVKFEEADVEAVVYLRTWRNDGMNGKWRWWLKKRGDTWAVFDFEDLDTSLRISTLMSLALPGRGQLAEWVHTMPRFQQAILSAMAGELEEGERILQGLAKSAYPASLEAVRLMLLGSIKLHQGFPDQALRHCKDAEALHADIPMIHLLRAMAHNQLGEYDPAATQARKYLDLLGADDQGYWELGQALAGLDRREEAAEAYRQGLDDNPDNLDILLALGRVLPEENKAELGRRLAKMTAPTEHFATLADNAALSEDAAALEALLTAYRPMAPRGDQTVDYYTVRLKILKKETAEAARLFKALMPRVGDEETRATYESGFLQAMSAADKPLEAYSAVPDPKTAFPTLANGLVWNAERLETLRQLIALHRKRRPNDHWLDFYTGRVHLLAKEYDQADKALAAGAAKAGSSEPEVADDYRYWRVQARFDAGRALSAYEDIGPKEETFNQLANLFVGAKDSKQLKALVAAHRQAVPGDKSLPLWDAEVHWLDGNHDQVIKVLKQHRATILQEEVNRWKYQDRLVRSLARTRQFGEAAREARGAGGDQESALLLAVVHALAGDLAKTEAALEKCLKDGYEAAEFYDDGDLGPALRSDRFRSLRMKYPEPKDEPPPR